MVLLYKKIAALTVNRPFLSVVNMKTFSRYPLAEVASSTATQTALQHVNVRVKDVDMWRTAVPALSKSLLPCPRHNAFSSVPVSIELFGDADLLAVAFRLPTRLAIPDIAGSGREPAHPRPDQQTRNPAC